MSDDGEDIGKRLRDANLEVPLCKSWTRFVLTAFFLWSHPSLSSVHPPATSRWPPSSATSASLRIFSVHAANSQLSPYFQAGFGLMVNTHLQLKLCSHAIPGVGRRTDCAEKGRIPRYYSFPKADACLS